MTLQALIAEHGTARSLKRGEMLFRQGDASPPCCHLHRGLLKATYLSAVGKEAIKSFFLAPTLVGSLRAAFEDAPAPYSVEALEACDLVELPLSKLRQQAQTDIELANDLIGLLVQLAIKKERREHDFLMLSAVENYRHLQREIPDLLGRVTQNDIARYLGITPVALSRIRGRLARG
ncbi:Crp/Fnr family transcriptional regulator [Actomonas aquatica]|uniref:Crp/Fnr family transcriptional regulator n=1 Tax=Actomonas aquatica TaxID=2866162 RepID=A0ABZ1CGW0_9BACT|nr:Crp/Fnr family transcriptional regulator [Opitutus sp. WL0086]WRQ89505.1 Crp/Fnr family transcriptional regulator [Opitutus sp. WL0086]